jgi:hypothetical protein
MCLAVHMLILGSRRVWNHWPCDRNTVLQYDSIIGQLLLLQQKFILFRYNDTLYKIRPNLTCKRKCSRQ